MMKAIFRRGRCCLAIAVLGALAGCSKPENPAADTPPADLPAPPERLTQAKAVLERMIQAYKKAASYADFGVLELHAQTAQGKVDWSSNYSVQFVRPNKLRVEINEGTVATNGRRWIAWIRDLPDQAVVREPPCASAWVRSWRTVFWPRRFPGRLPAGCRRSGPRRSWSCCWPTSPWRALDRESGALAARSGPRRRRRMLPRVRQIG